MKTTSALLVTEKVNLIPASGDVASPQDGDIWYNDTTDKFRKRENGVTSDLGAVATSFDLVTNMMVTRNNFWSGSY